MCKVVVLFFLFKDIPTDSLLIINSFPLSVLTSEELQRVVNVLNVPIGFRIQPRKVLI